MFPHITKTSSKSFLKHEQYFNFAPHFFFIFLFFLVSGRLQVSKIQYIVNITHRLSLRKGSKLLSLQLSSKLADFHSEKEMANIFSPAWCIAVYFFVYLQTYIYNTNSMWHFPLSLAFKHVQRRQDIWFPCLICILFTNTFILRMV